MEMDIKFERLNQESYDSLVSFVRKYKSMRDSAKNLAVTIGVGNIATSNPPEYERVSVNINYEKYVCKEILEGLAELVDSLESE